MSNDECEKASGAAPTPARRLTKPRTPRDFRHAFQRSRKGRGGLTEATPAPLPPHYKSLMTPPSAVTWERLFFAGRFDREFRSRPAAEQTSKVDPQGKEDPSSPDGSPPLGLASFARRFCASRRRRGGPPGTFGCKSVFPRSAAMAGHSPWPAPPVPNPGIPAAPAAPQAAENGRPSQGKHSDATELSRPARYSRSSPGVTAQPAEMAGWNSIGGNCPHCADRRFVLLD